MSKNNHINLASFRDPDGFVFKKKNIIYRQINQSSANNYDFFIESGLYARLINLGLLVSHTESSVTPPQPDIAYKVIKPDNIPFISYPYEWPFGFLKSAALATLKIQKKAIEHGMSLKDASAYNIQMLHGKPVFIDTLSFEIYQSRQPWTAYRQFCQHFLAPLALMAHTDIRLNHLIKSYIDGIPLNLASRLLPFHAKLDPGLLMHVHLHAQAQKQFEKKAIKQQSGRPIGVSKEGLAGLLESLEKTVKKLSWNPVGTEWGSYYEETNYTDAAFQQKRSIISGWLDRINPASVWDLGANDGSFSREASNKGINTIAFDIDPAAVEKNYQRLKANKEKSLTPLVLDLTNPSPAIGWHNKERNTIFERGEAEMVFVLALIHHLAISNNVPLPLIANFLADTGSWIVIEFIPKSDSQAQKLLQNRPDIFSDYHLEGFELAFMQHFNIVEKLQIQESERFLYLMKRK